jgi:hypothetical protein
MGRESPHLAACLTQDMLRRGGYLFFPSRMVLQNYIVADVNDSIQDRLLAFEG